MSGRLQKMGVVNKRFKERWFVLSGNKLFYYKSKESNSAIHFIPLDEAYIRVSPEYFPNSPCFEIVTASRIFQLVAPNFQVMQEWVNSAQKHSKINNDNWVLSVVDNDIVTCETRHAKQLQEEDEFINLDMTDRSSMSELADEDSWTVLDSSSPNTIIVE